MSKFQTTVLFSGMIINRRTLLLEQLADAERSVLTNEVRIRDQKQVISEHKQAGRDTAVALELLEMLKDSHALHVAARDRIKSGLSSL